MKGGQTLWSHTGQTFMSSLGSLLVQGKQIKQWKVKSLLIWLNSFSCFLFLSVLDTGSWPYSRINVKISTQLLIAVKDLSENYHLFIWFPMQLIVQCVSINLVTTHLPDVLYSHIWSLWHHTNKNSNKRRKTSVVCFHQLDHFRLDNTEQDNKL